MIKHLQTSNGKNFEIAFNALEKLLFYKRSSLAERLDMGRELWRLLQHRFYLKAKLLRPSITTTTHPNATPNAKTLTHYRHQKGLLNDDESAPNREFRVDTPDDFLEVEPEPGLSRSSEDSEESDSSYKESEEGSEEGTASEEESEEGSKEGTSSEEESEED